MKRIAGLLCCLLLLAACGGKEAAFEDVPKATAPVGNQNDVRPELPKATPAPVPTPAPSPEVPTLEEARNLIQRANDALAPFLWDSSTEGTLLDWEWADWYQLRDYDSKEELLNGLKQVFTDDLAENFFDRYDRELLWERDGAVYVPANGRDILGYYYDMDLNTLTFDPDPAPYLLAGLALTADGYGNGTPVQWRFGLELEGGEYQIGFYACYGVGSNMEEEPYTILLDGVPYKMRSDAGSPEWLGEPYRVVEKGTGDRKVRFEYYPGLKVELHDWDIWWTEVPGFHPASIWVTGPGIPTSRGVEVGDTMQEVLAAYPQFDMWGVDTGEDAVYQRCYPWGRGEYQGDTIYFIFDENYILQEIYYHFNVSL